jgi:hypothetical protein
MVVRRSKTLARMRLEENVEAVVDKQLDQLVQIYAFYPKLMARYAN